MRSCRDAGLGGGQVLAMVVGATEFAEVPVRHNEDRINAQLAQEVRWPLPKPWGPDSPHAKAHLLLQVLTPKPLEP